MKQYALVASFGILVFTFLAPGAALGQQEEISIETSAEDHGNSFFGQGVLRVIVADPDYDNGNTVEAISVEIEANPEGESGTSVDILVPETSESSGRFEFYLAHINSLAVGPTDLNPRNSAGVEGDGSCALDCAPFVTFGVGGNIDINSELYERVSFEIVAGDTEITIDYQETPGTLQLDRSSYGTTSFVYVSIDDQDANLNPTENDQFTVNGGDEPNEDLFELNGGSLEGSITFRETGDNTGVFEGKYRLGDSIIINTESLSLTLHEKANYNATLSADENDSNNSDEISFTVGNSDGSVDVGGGQPALVTWDPMIEFEQDSYSAGENVTVTVSDQDANIDSDSEDSILLRARTGGNILDISATETGVDTGVFEASFSLGETTDAASNMIAPSGSITIAYVDKRPADYSEKVQAGDQPEKEFTLEVDIQTPFMSGVDATDLSTPAVRNLAGQNGPFLVDNSLTLATAIMNNNNQEQPLVVIFDVRDSQGATIYLGFQSGMLEPNGHTEIGIQWQPSQTGTYEIRTFAISDLEETELLSRPASTTIMVQSI